MCILLFYYFYLCNHVLRTAPLFLPKLHVNPKSRSPASRIPTARPPPYLKAQSKPPHCFVSLPMVLSKLAAALRPFWPPPPCAMTSALLDRFDMQLAQALGETVFEKGLREKVTQENTSVRWELGQLQQRLKVRDGAGVGAGTEPSWLVVAGFQELCPTPHHAPAGNSDREKALRGGVGRRSAGGMPVCQPAGVMNPRNS